MRFNPDLNSSQAHLYDPEKESAKGWAPNVSAFSTPSTYKLAALEAAVRTASSYDSKSIVASAEAFYAFLTDKPAA